MNHRNLCAGYEIVCPDGRVRHYPYHNEGDAESDARTYTRKQHCRVEPDDPRGWGDPPCPQGEHTTRPIAMMHPQAPEVGSA